VVDPVTFGSRSHLAPWNMKMDQEVTVMGRFGQSEVNDRREPRKSRHLRRCRPHPGADDQRYRRRPGLEIRGPAHRAGREISAGTLACDLRILLGYLAVQLARIVVFTVDRLPGPGPVLRSPGAAPAGPGAFRCPGRSAQVRAETAESEPDPVGAQDLSRPGFLVPGPAQVID